MCAHVRTRPRHWPLFEELFTRAVLALKRNFPAVKIGGPGMGLSSYCTPDPTTGRKRVGGQGVEMQPFVERLVRDKVPLDFVSWHRYSNFPARIAECAQEVRAMLPPAWEMYVTEWNLGVAGPFNTTAAASMATAMWIGLQDHADGSFMYWGCCAEFPYSAGGLGAKGDGLALFAANASLPWKPQALAFAMWHNMSRYPSRKVVTVWGDLLTPLVALAGTSDAGESAVLIANPQNRSVSFSLSQPNRRPMCSMTAACAVTQIRDNSGEVVESSSAGGNVSIAAWGTMLVRLKTDDRPGQGVAFGRPHPLQLGHSNFIMPVLLLAAASSAAAEGPCDILGAAGNPCVAAHSTVSREWSGGSASVDCTKTTASLDFKLLPKPQLAHKSDDDQSQVDDAQVDDAQDGWSHGWDTGAEMWWGYIAPSGRGVTNGEFLTADQLKFIASTYPVIVLSGQPHTATVDGKNISMTQFMQTISARLKKLNKRIKVLQYFNVDMWAGYENYDPQFAAFRAHPEWWLRDDNGVPVIGNAGQPEWLGPVDWENEEAVEFWLSLFLSSPQAYATIDGILADGGSEYDAQLQNVSAARKEALKLAKFSMLGRLQQIFTAANDGFVFANGMSGGQIAPGDEYNLKVLDYVGGMESERFAVFGQVDHETGALLKDKVVDMMLAIDNLTSVASGTKALLMNFWPGPIVGITDGWPSFAPGDPVNKQPNGTNAEKMAGWQKLNLEYFPFNFIGFLMVASSRTFFTQLTWYELSAGAVPCPTAPLSCTAPEGWYPDMNKPLGAPLGPRLQLAPYKWRREFAHATVTLDLDDPLGNGSQIVWSH